VLAIGLAPEPARMNCPESVTFAGPPGRKLDRDDGGRAQSPKRSDDESPRRGSG